LPASPQAPDEKAGGVHSPMRTGLSQPTPVIHCYLHFFRDKDPCLLL
jgi:hypothetical protein